jgi:hypothetical protein
MFGPVIGWLVGALEGAIAVGGVSALGAALYSIGVPNDSSLEYETALKSDSFLVIAHGTAQEVTNAKEILVSAGAAQVDVHQGAGQ